MSVEGPGNIDRRKFLKGAAAAAITLGLSADSDQPQAMKERISNESYDRWKKERPLPEMETIESGGRPMEIVDVRPEVATEKPAILLSPAWAVPVSIYRPALTTLKANGRRVLSFNNPRSEGRTEVTPDQQKKLEGFSFSQDAVQKAMDILAVLDSKVPDHAPISAIGHSNGAIGLMIAALIEPERFKSIVLYGPSGMMEGESRTRLATGFIKQGLQPVAPTLGNLEDWPQHKQYMDTLSEEDKAAYRRSIADAQAKGEMGTYVKISDDGTAAGVRDHLEGEMADYASQNKMLTVKEMWQMPGNVTLDILAKLKEAGVTVGIVSGVDDQVFPAKNIMESLSATKPQGADITTIVDGFLSVRGGHGDMNEHPEEFMVPIESLMSKLEKKRQH